MEETMKELFGEKIYNLRKKIDELPDEFLNQYIIYMTYFNQYAPGITGATRNARFIISKDGTGFPYAAAAYKAVKDAGIKPYEKKGRETPYGNVGCEVLKRKAITVREALQMSSYHMTPSTFTMLKA